MASTRDIEARGPSQPDSATPLLPSAQQHLSQLRASRDFFDCHIVKIHGEETTVFRIRRRLQDFLASKWGHYFVLCLVSLDVLGIFATFLISLHLCEHGGEKGFNKKPWVQTNAVLGLMSLIFSSLFMAELVASLFAFGFG